MTDTQPPAAQPTGARPVIVLGGRIDSADIPALCERARVLLEVTGRFTLRCEVDRIHPDATAIDALARMALTCRRLGRRLELHGASSTLEGLVIFAGLLEVLPCLPSEGTTGNGAEEPIRPRGAAAARTAERTGRCRGRT